MSNEMTRLAAKNKGSMMKKPAKRAMEVYVADVNLLVLEKAWQEVFATTRSNQTVPKGRPWVRVRKPKKQPIQTSDDPIVSEPNIAKEPEPLLPPDVADAVHPPPNEEEAPPFESLEEEEASYTTLHHLTKNSIEESVKGYNDDPVFSTTYNEPNSALGGNDPSERFARDTDGLLWFRDASDNLRLCIPRGRLQNNLLRTSHESPFETAHAGGHKLLQRLRLKSYWPSMRTSTLR